MSLQDFFIYDSNDVSGTCFTSAVNNEQYQIQEVFIIYKTTNQINGKIYIGQHKIESPELSAVFDGYLGGGILLQKAIKKYGNENFKRETLELCFSKEEVNKREIYWISQLSATNLEIGYNIANGGQGGNIIPWTEERCNKISNTQRGKYSIYNPKTKQYRFILKNQLIPKGWIKQGRLPQHWMNKVHYIHIYNPKTDEDRKIDKNDPIPEGFILGGKPKSESFKEKMKKPKSKEHVQKVINALLGIKHTEERKQKNSESNKMYIWIYNSELKIRKRHKKDQPIPEGWIRGMGPMSEENKKYLSEIRKINGTFKGKNNPMYGSKYYWVYNPITKQRKRNPLDQPIPEGWIKGKKII